jgi:UDPglucose 6-dehydrogenase
VHAVAKGMGMDKRIGNKFLHAGPGYGGSCFPKDTTALIRIAQEHGTPCRIVEAAVEVNAAQKALMIKKIRKALGGSVSGKTIAVLGLTFKPETDDMRDAPVLAILPNLIDKGAVIHAHDPQGMEEAKKLLPGDVNYYNDVYEAITGADAVILMTEWNEYRGLDFDRLKNLMQGNAFIDLRNVYEKAHLTSLGFDYTCVGR